MKRFIFIFGLVILLTACTGNQLESFDKNYISYPTEDSEKKPSIPRPKPGIPKQKNHAGKSAGFYCHKRKGGRYGAISGKYQ